MADASGAPDLRVLAAEKVAGKLEAHHRNGEGRPPRPEDSLPVLAGGWTVPSWFLNPGSYRALRVAELQDPVQKLWGTIFSRCGPECRPCLHNRDQLAGAIGKSARTVSRHLDALESAGLVFSVERGEERQSRRHRSKARWALDPLAVDKWRPKVEGKLERLAEMDGQSSHWVRGAVAALDGFELRARDLRNRLEDDVPPALVGDRRKPKRKQRGEKWRDPR